MTYTKTVWTDNVTPVDAAKMNNIESGIASMFAATSATPPGSPVDGQIWYLPAAAGVTWAFRYNAGSASAYKWEFIGGLPMMAYNNTAGSVGSANTWTDIGGVPQITTPRAGDYKIDIQARLANGATAGQAGFVTAVVSGGSPGNFQVGASVMAASQTTDVAGFLSGAQLADFAGIPASTIIRMMYYSSSTALQFANRTLNVTPIRVS